MKSVGDTVSLSHPDTFMFDYLAPSHYHTTYQVHLCISVGSLGVSREFCRGLVYATGHSLLSYMLFRTKEKFTCFHYFTQYLLHTNC